jgi:sporulation related protein
MTAGAKRRCGNCGQPLAPQASFCRSCGNRYEEPAAYERPATHEEPAAAATQTLPDPTLLEPTMPRPRQPTSRPLRAALWLGGAIILAGAGVAVAILLSSGGGSASTTVVSREGQPAAAGGETVTLSPHAGSLEANRYVQAGSFKFQADAEAERERLAAAGIEVEVLPSELARQLYPGFQVLLGGPFSSDAAEAQLLRELHHSGVPSAFGRELTPAAQISDPAVVGGSWTGSLERSSSSRPGLDGPLPASLSFDGDGRHGSLQLGGCDIELTLAPSTTAALTYDERSACDESGDWQMRPAGDQLMLAQLPSGDDLIVLGTLERG